MTSLAPIVLKGTAQVNKGKSVPSNTNSQKKESSGDSFFDSDSSKLEKSKQKQHTKPSAKDDFFKS